MNKKEENARMLDPMRFKIAQQNSVIPGGPQNNSPDPVVQSSGEPINGKSIYNDYAQNYQQMGSAILNPINVRPSGLQQSNQMMQGLNAQAPYGMQQQPDTSGVSTTPDEMESFRLGSEVANKGLNAGPMGLTGMPAQPAPGAFPGAFPGSSGQPLMPGMQSAEQAAGGMAPQNSMNPMTPGSTPTKIKKKRK
jgi:hypothetical protein